MAIVKMRPRSDAQRLNQSLGQRRHVCGIGVNDADYLVFIKGKWICPFYRVWSDMIGRCYTNKPSGRQKSHYGVSVCEDWLLFSRFKAWMEAQDWDGKVIDKDLIGDGTEYSPVNCLFIDGHLNSFLQRPINHPFGVSIRRNGMIVGRGKSGYLGTFTTKDAAHKAWQIDMAGALRSKAKHYPGRIGLALLDKADKICADHAIGAETKHY
jgi:hypothetical protein